MQDKETNNQFWWLRHDWVTYKVPFADGEILLSDDYLDPSSVIDPRRHWYKFGSDREDARKIADFSAFNGGALFVNLRAYDSFKDILLPNCRSFPILCSNLPHYIVVVDSAHDAIDMQLSEFIRVSNDGPVEEDISKINKIVLKQGFSTDDDIFRIDRGHALSLEIIVSDRFKARYDQSGLTGLFFKDVSHPQSLT